MTLTDDGRIRTPELQRSLLRTTGQKPREWDGLKGNISLAKGDGVMKTSRLTPLLLGLLILTLSPPTLQNPNRT